MTRSNVRLFWTLLLIAPTAYAQDSASVQMIVEVVSGPVSVALEESERSSLHNTSDVLSLRVQDQRSLSRKDDMYVLLQSAQTDTPLSVIVSAASFLDPESLWKPLEQSNQEAETAQLLLPVTTRDQLFQLQATDPLNALAITVVAESY